MSADESLINFDNCSLFYIDWEYVRDQLQKENNSFGKPKLVEFLLTKSYVKQNCSHVEYNFYE